MFAKELFAAGMETIESRGRHATGLAACGGSDPFIFKWAKPLSIIKNEPVWTGAIERISDDVEVVIGHTRYATLPNSDKDEAAHPFKQGRVVGAHNGIITNWRTIESQMKPEKPWIVDSQAAFAILDAFKKPADALEHLEGYFALSWTKMDTSSKDPSKHRPKFYLMKSRDAVLSGAYIPKIRLLIWNSLSHNITKLMKELSVKESEYMLWDYRSDTIYEYDVMKFTHKSTNVVKHPWKEKTPVVKHYGPGTNRYTGNQPSTTAVVGGRHNMVRGFVPRDEVIADARAMLEQEVEFDLGRSVPRVRTEGAQITLQEIRQEVDDLWGAMGTMRQAFGRRIGELLDRIEILEEDAEEARKEIDLLQIDNTTLWNACAAAGVDVQPIEWVEDEDEDEAAESAPAVTVGAEPQGDGAGEQLDLTNELREEFDRLDARDAEDDALAMYGFDEDEDEDDGESPYVSTEQHGDRTIKAPIKGQCIKCEKFDVARGRLLPVGDPQDDNYVHEQCLIEDMEGVS